MQSLNLYGVGSAKSGTHSLSGLFKKKYRAAHEPEWQADLRMIFRMESGGAGLKEAHDYIRGKHDRLRLDLNSSQLNFYFLSQIIEHVPEAKYILTIRDCISWVDSFTRHQARFPEKPNSLWSRYRELRFGAAERYDGEEKILADQGLYPLRNYFRYWARHNKEVVDRVPGDKLLILPTQDLSGQLDRLSEFAGVNSDTLDQEASLQFADPHPTSIVKMIDPSFLLKVAEEECGEAMENLLGDSPMSDYYDKCFDRVS